MKWAFQHVREIVPSADIANSPEDVWQLESDAADFSSFRFQHGGEAYTLDRFLADTDTDGLVILHRGKVILRALRQWNDVEHAAHSDVGVEILDRYRCRHPHRARASSIRSRRLFRSFRS